MKILSDSTLRVWISIAADEACHDHYFSAFSARNSPSSTHNGRRALVAIVADDTMAGAYFEAITILEAFTAFNSPLSALHSRRALVTLYVLYIAVFVSYACLSCIINVVLFFNEFLLLLFII